MNGINRIRHKIIDKTEYKKAPSRARGYHKGDRGGIERALIGRAELP